MVTRPVPDGVVDFPAVVVEIFRAGEPYKDKENMMFPHQKSTVTRIVLIIQSNEI